MLVDEWATSPILSDGFTRKDWEKSGFVSRAILTHVECILSRENLVVFFFKDFFFFFK